MRKHVLAGFLAFLLVSPSVAGAYDPELKKFILVKYYADALDNFDVIMSETKLVREFEDGTKVTNCNEYLKALKVLGPPEYINTMERIIECRYVGCKTIDMLTKAKPHKGYRPKSYAEELYKRLDYRAITYTYYDSSLPERARTMAELKGGHFKSVNNHAIERDEEEDACDKVEVKADADLNGNGKPDWIVSYDYKSHIGSGIACLLYVIYDVEPTGMLAPVEVK